MEFEVLYWHWLVFGMVLMMCEIFIPSFTIFWFGLAAICVGGTSYFLGFQNLTGEILVWVILSIMFAVYWFKFIRPKATDKTLAGLSREAVVGERGMIVKAPEGDCRGEVRFAIPLLGSDTWTCISLTPVRVGDSVIVKDVHGNSLLVESAAQNGGTKND